MNLKAIEAVATSVRTLSIDGIQKANSGHPGLPMGCAELGSLLYGEIMNHNPADSKWLNRDRFVLSAGHGSMFLYSLLHLSGYKVSLEDLKNFRQVGSKTPGHPEYGWTDGVETTTGPLGAGFSNAVGMAIAEQMMAAKYNKGKKIIDHYTFSIAGDGCMMEGISQEAASLAGHLGLGKLIVFYDSNKITIEGSTDLAFTEDVVKRFEAYGWQTLEGDAYDLEGIMKLVDQAKAETSKPTLIKLESIIGKGSPNMEGSHKVHGAPLGADEIVETRKNLGVPVDQDFYIAPEAVEYFKAKKEEWKKAYDAWQADFAEWAKANPELEKELDESLSGKVDLSNVKMPEYKVGDKMATRQASGASLQAMAAGVPYLVGGSADLAPSNNTALPGLGDFSKEDRAGRTLHYGVREHAMGGVANGIVLHGGFRTFCATFLVFIDYMRPTVRLAALMGLPVTYVMTHDSIYVGEDGPTHQPIEHIESLRIIPNVTVIRPADGQETEEAWKYAMEKTDGPVVLGLTRQALPVFEKADKNWKENFRKGAYIAKDCEGTPDVIIVATGSEVTMAIEAAEKVSAKKIRVVSVSCRNLFFKQDKAFRDSIIPRGIRTIVAEAGVGNGWHGVASGNDNVFCINRFGESGPAAKVAEELGMTADALVKVINK